MKPLVLSRDAWGLIVKIALVILIIVVIVGFLKSYVANTTLNEHSSCQQFQQADTTIQDKVLQDMFAAHNNSFGSISTLRDIVTFYCDYHDINSPIDGIY